MKINIEKLDKLLNKIIIGLCIIIVVSGFNFFLEYKITSWTYEPDPDSLLWYISDQDYNSLSDRLLRYYHNNPQGQLKECLAVANYYKNTAFYKMHEEVGNDEKAKIFLDLMTENIRDMGDLSFATDDINKELGVELALPSY